MAAHNGQPALGAKWVTMLKVQGTMTCLMHVSKCRVTSSKRKGKAGFPKLPCFLSYPSHLYQ